VTAVRDTLEIAGVNLALIVDQEEPVADLPVRQFATLFEFRFKMTREARHHAAYMTRRAMMRLAVGVMVQVGRKWRVAGFTFRIHGASVKQRRVADTVTVHLALGVAIHTLHSSRFVYVGVALPLQLNQAVAMQTPILRDRVTGGGMAIGAKWTVAFPAFQLVVRYAR
jgi:hypothetical protein